MGDRDGSLLLEGAAVPDLPDVRLGGRSIRFFSTQWHRPSPSFASLDMVLLIIHVFRFFEVTYLRTSESGVGYMWENEIR